MPNCFTFNVRKHELFNHYCDDEQVLVVVFATLGNVSVTKHLI